MARMTFGPLKTIFKGKIFSIHTRPVTLPNGKKVMFEYCQRPASVSILAFNEKNELLMIKEHRHEYKKNIWFLPAGKMDQRGDTPKKAAQRELREETGYAAKTLKLIHKKSPSNTLQWDIYTFAAKNLFRSPLPRDPGERITEHFVPFKKAIEMALNGEIENEFIAYNIIRFNEMLKRGQFKW